MNFQRGTDDYAVTAGELEIAYDKFADTESLDINLVLGGPSSAVADTKTAQDTHVTMITEPLLNQGEIVLVSYHHFALQL